MNKEFDPKAASAGDLLQTTVGAEIVNELRKGSHDSGVYLSPAYVTDTGAAVQLVDENGDIVGVVSFPDMAVAEIGWALLKAGLAKSTGIMNGFDFAEREAGFGSASETPTEES